MRYFQPIIFYIQIRNNKIARASILNYNNNSPSGDTGQFSNEISGIIRIFHSTVVTRKNPKIIGVLVKFSLKISPQKPLCKIKCIYLSPQINLDIIKLHKLFCIWRLFKRKIREILVTRYIIIYIIHSRNAKSEQPSKTYIKKNKAARIKVIMVLRKKDVYL